MPVRTAAGRRHEPVAIRLAGQGALGLAASTAVAVHVTRRRGLALGLTSAVGSAGISLAPVLLERVISTHGLSTAWLLEGLAVWLIVIPIALLVFGRRPLHPGRQTTAGGAPAGHAPPAAAGWSARDALRTPMFWVIAAAVAASGMLTTGLNFHQIAALGEQGLTPSQAALNFLPQAVTTMTVTIAIGALADKVAPKYGLVVAMLLLAGSLLTLSMVDSMWTALLYGGLLGAAGGSVRTVEAAAFTHYFGTANIGAIRGLATTISVASTAFGPLALSLGQDLTGSYGTTALGLLLIPLTVAVGAVLVRPPQPRGGPAAGASADRLDHTPA